MKSPSFLNAKFIIVQTLVVPSVAAIEKAYPGVPIDMEYFESKGEDSLH